MDIRFQRHTVGPRSDFGAVRALLAEDDLELDKDVEVVITAHDEQGTLVGCGSIARDVLKCIAIAKSMRGEGLALPLMTELVATAWEMGRRDLFLYTKPDNEEMFSQCGFTTLAAVPGSAVLMENNKQRLPRYCRELAALRKPGERIAGLVMNCNPFTLGHRYLVEESARRCDWVHLFVVREDLSLFPYADRLTLIRQGTKDLPNVTVHPGSDYIISRATFPSYFLKDAAVIDKAYTGIDIQIFRRHIAPALGITHRFVGTEPLSAITQRYNEDMTHWLGSNAVDAPPIVFEILPRKELEGEPVSASRVRKLWIEQGVEAVRFLVPPTTFAYLGQHEEIRQKGSTS